NLIIDLQITCMLHNITAVAAELLLKAFIDNCNFLAKISIIPKNHNPPVYGSRHLSYFDYVAPRMIV
uniref:Uncharacterized protein n=1 Tax=Amphimedon queenslandica TaxID=400682 RepID=A0A1X7V1L3_AMPQE